MADRLDLKQLRAAMGYGWKDWHYGDSLHDADIGALDTILDAARFLLSLADEGGRLERVVLCEHGFDESHRVFTDARGMERCAKGSRTVVWPPKEGER